MSFILTKGAIIMNIAVCDSDAEIALDIKNLITDSMPKMSVKIFSSAEELLSNEHFFDIYFLDIKGISGLNIARKIREKEKDGGKKSVVVFVTGYSEYMAEAFDVQAFHYLIKPIGKEKFIEVLKNAMNEIKCRRRYEDKFILLKIQNQNRKIELKNILYLESNNKKVIFHLVEETFEIQGKMENYERILGDSFYRCHRCYLVNFEKISSYTSTEIEIINGDKIMLAQKKYSSFVKAYLAYARTGGAVNV